MSWPGERRPDLWLRPGVAPVYDDIVYQQRLGQIDKRNGFDLDGQPVSATDAFVPALALWTVVQSIPDGDTAVLAAGIRDFPIDAGYPTLLGHYRAGQQLNRFAAGAFSIAKANDQHAYLPLAGLTGIHIGDILKFGISHPCTTFDRWPMLFMVDGEDRVVEVVKTYF
jgi:D-serine dehydratase